ncbi:MAG TPA: hypothetical protein VGG44_03775 [Tepidisphaeraceae bacterium]
MVSLKEPREAIHRMMEPSCETSKNVTRGVSLLGIALLGIAVVTAIMVLPDMKRYVRMKTM